MPSIHSGHRQRMKQEYLSRGLEGMPEHKVLELLLFYAIPQGDVNGLAHDLIDRFGDYPTAVGNLLLISKLKRRADLALLSQIKRQRDNIMITFSPKGSRLVKAAEIIKQLAKTHFKATLGENDQRLTVRLVIQPKMTTNDWLNQLLKFVGGLADVVQNNNQAA